MENEVQYLIPRNVKAKFQFFEGFGFTELFLTLIGLATGMILFFILGIFTKHFMRILVILFPTIISYLITKTDPRMNMSMLTMIKSFNEFNTKQRRYLYYYGRGRS